MCISFIFLNIREMVGKMQPHLWKYPPNRSSLNIPKYKIYIHQLLCTELIINKHIIQPVENINLNIIYCSIFSNLQISNGISWDRISPLFGGLACPESSMPCSYHFQYQLLDCSAKHTCGKDHIKREGKILHYALSIRRGLFIRLLLIWKAELDAKLNLNYRVEKK